MYEHTTKMGMTNQVCDGLNDYLNVTDKQKLHFISTSIVIVCSMKLRGENVVYSFMCNKQM